MNQLYESLQERNVERYIPPTFAVENTTLEVFYVGYKSYTDYTSYSHSISRTTKHQHPYYELYGITEGTFRIFFGETDITLHSGELFIIPPGVKHITVPLEPHAKWYTAFFSFTHCNTKHAYNLHALLAKTLANPFWGNLQTAAGCLSHLSIMTAAYQNTQPLLLYAETLSMLVKLCNNSMAASITNDSSTHRLMQISSYIDAHLDKPVSLRQLARELSLSTRQLDRIIRTEYGVCFTDLVSQRRLDIVCKLLQTTSTPISEIALSIGSSSSAAFSSWFKKYMGMTPSAYRKQGKQ